MRAEPGPVALCAEHADAAASLKWEKVQAWTETRTTSSLVARPSSAEDCEAVVGFAKSEGMSICARGAGYSYGDMILNDGQIVLNVSRMSRILSWDPLAGLIKVEPGVTFAQILGKVLGSSWTLASCVGGVGVTAAGAVSNNVHGKDSWKLGNFGDHVVELTILTAGTQRLRVTRNDTDLFRSIVAGMGLLGIILDITLQLRRVPSPFLQVTTTPVRDLRESLDAIERARETSDFIIAWVDAFAGGRSLGRGTVETASWIEADRPLGERQLRQSLTMPQYLFGVLPANLAWSIARPFFRPVMMQAANTVKYWKDRLRGQQQGMALFTDFNFMLNRIPGWKQLYRPYGYMEFQPMMPRKLGESGLAAVLRMCQADSAESLLCAIKPHRPDDYFLSYEGDGYSIGIDIALRGRNRHSVESFARKLYEYVAGSGGKTFLAKDEILPRDLFERMYPSHVEFLSAKRRIDPDGVFSSDMFRRLLA